MAADEAFTGPAHQDWQYVVRSDGEFICGRCGLLIGKVGPHMDWHRWLDIELGRRVKTGLSAVQATPASPALGGK